MELIGDLKLDFTSEDEILQLQGDIKSWFGIFLNVYQAKDVTPYLLHYIAMFLNSCHCIKTLHITLNKVWKNTTIELLKTFSDPQITKELMHLNNSF